MFPALSILSATIGMLLIVFLILREMGDKIGPTETRMLQASYALVVVIGTWQVYAQMTAGAH